MSLIRLAETPTVANVPEGLKVGRPIRVLTVGDIHSRFTGKRLARVTATDLAGLVALFEDRSAPRPDQSEPDPVILDWNHNSTRDDVPPDVSTALGRVVALSVEGEALYAVPAYTPRGVKLVEDSAGVLWPSPEWTKGPVRARESGKKLGKIQLLALTLTPRPQQTGDRIDKITLNEARPGAGVEETMADQKATEAAGTNAAAEMTPEERLDALEAGMAEIMAKLDAMAGGGEGEEATEEDAETSEASEEASDLTLKFAERLRKLERETSAAREDAAIAKLYQERKIVKAGEELARETFRASADLFAKIYVAREVGSAGPKPSPLKGGAAPVDDAPFDDAAGLDKEIKRVMASEKIEYVAAARKVRDANPEAYALARNGG